MANIILKNTEDTIIKYSYDIQDCLLGKTIKSIYCVVTTTIDTTSIVDLLPHTQTTQDFH